MRYLYLCIMLACAAAAGGQVGLAMGRHERKANDGAEVARIEAELSAAKAAAEEDKDLAKKNEGLAQSLWMKDEKIASLELHIRNLEEEGAATRRMSTEKMQEAVRRAETAEADLKRVNQKRDALMADLQDQQRQAQLASELAAERKQQVKEKGALAQQQAATQSTQAGFNAFVEEQQNLSGPRQIKGGSSKGGARYSQGPWKGKTQGEGMEMAIRQWEALSSQQRMAYERRTTLYGSTHQYRQDSLSPNSDQGQYISNTGQMMPSPENFSGPRTVLMNGRSYMVQENGNTKVITGTRAGESFTATQNGNTTVITGGRSHVLDY